jgi:hypothetical protein
LASAHSDHSLIATQPQLLDEVQVARHLVVILATLAVLLVQDRRGGAGVSGEEQEKVVFEIEQGLFGDPKGRDGDRAVGGEIEAGDAAVRRDVLILFTDWLLQQVDLDVTGLLGELLWMHHVLAIGVQGLQQGGRETPGRAQPRAGRNVGHARDFQIPRVDGQRAQRLTDDRMTNVVDRRCLLELRVFQQESVDEARVNIDVHVLVDGGRNQEATVLAVIGQQISAATTERYPQWRTRDDHRAVFYSADRAHLLVGAIAGRSACARTLRVD